MHIDLIPAEELARRLGYTGATNAFREWCVSMGIRPVPGRRGFYDPVHVRRRLDIMQGLDQPAPQAEADRPLSLVEQRRARRGAA